MGRYNSIEDFQPVAEGEQQDEDPIVSTSVGVTVDQLASIRSLQKMLVGLQQDINAEWNMQVQHYLQEQITRTLAREANS